MTDNFQQLRNYMHDFGLLSESVNRKCDYYFDVQIIRRGKDNPDLPAANYQLKAYYIDSFEKFDRVMPEIKSICNMFKCRAYISSIIKSKRKLAKKTLVALAQMLENGDVSAPWRVIEHSSGKVVSEYRRWVVDIDDIDTKAPSIVDDYIQIIRTCDCGHEDPFIMRVKTKSGVHLITHPFNLMQFRERTKEAGYDDIADVKKNHITLLYENL